MSLTNEDYARIDKTLARLVDADLSQWDRDFVDDQIKRLAQWEIHTRFSARQLDQIERMERQYL